MLDGNAGRRPLNDQEPQPDGDLFAPPHWMTDKQKDVWRYALETAPAGLLKRLDASIFTVWVVASDLHREASEKVQMYGAMVKSGVNQIPMQSPYLSIMNKQAQIMMKAASEMGFTPSSRSRVKIDRTKNPGKNPFDGLKELGD